MKRYLILATLTFAGVLGAQTRPAAGSAPATISPKDVVATVNGEVITIADLNRMYYALPPAVRENYDAGGGRGQFLDQYMRKRLLVQEAMKNNFDKDPKIAALLRDARESALFDLYVRTEIANDIVPEADIRKYYDEHIADFKTPERVRARHILVTPIAEQRVPNTSGDNAKNEEEAQRKIENLDKMYGLSGGNFAELAMRFSEDGSAPQGGDLGWFERGRMVPEFEKVAFETPKGRVSGVVKTQFGYHRIFVEDRRDAATKPYDEVRNEIRERLLSERADRVMVQLNTTTMELQGQSKIQLFKENIPE